MGVLAPDLAIARTHGGGFVKGQTADYTITVSNAGAGSTAPGSADQCGVYPDVGRLTVQKGAIPFRTVPAEVAGWLRRSTAGSPTPTRWWRSEDVGPARGRVKAGDSGNACRFRPGTGSLGARKLAALP